MRVLRWRLPMGRWLRFGGGVVLVAAGVLLISYAALAAPRYGPQERQIDSDGRVPVVSVCLPRQEWLAGADYRRLTRDGEPLVRAKVRVNDCLLEKLGAGPQDRHNVISHEMAHTRGWDHFDGRPRINPGYYPKYRITGR